MYSKLDGPSPLFRLLHLLPGQKPDKIECKLEALSLDQPKEFEALSYVWGTPTSTLSITLDGQTINVTRSLHLALCYLRYTDRIRTLWVDAVCINQADVNEKNHQVRLMGRIYSTAKEVIVWLGEYRDEHSGVIRLIETVGNDKDIHWNDPAVGMENTVSFVLHLYFFFKNPWWYRVWTAQEAVLAQKLTYQYGNRKIQGAALDGMIQSWNIHLSSCCINVKNKLGGSGLNFNELAGIIRLQSSTGHFLHQRQGKNFCQAVTYFRHRSATNPLDKIYSLLGIIDDAESISVDYGLSVSDGYEKFAREILTNTRRLDLFSHLIPGSAVSRPSRVEGLPSWAPDWDCEYNTYRRPSLNTNIRVRTLDMFNACGSRDYSPWHGDAPGSLRLRGIVFDEILSISSSIYSNLSLGLEEVLQDWRTMAQIETNPDKQYPSGETIMEAFWRTLSLDLSCSMTSGSDDGILKNRAESNDRLIHDTFWFIALLELHGIPIGDIIPESFQNQIDGNLFNQHIQQTIFERRFFFTKKGYMGLGPDGIFEGDKVCVLAGGRLPFILREIKPSSNQVEDLKAVNIFQILGDTYLHGIMDGEAMKKVDEKLQTFELR